MNDFELFSELEKKSLDESGGISDDVKKSLHESISLFSFIGECIELFVPKLFGVAGALTDIQRKIEDAG